MLGIYISMVKSLQEKLNRMLKAVNQLITNDISKDMPMIALSVKLLHSISGVGFLTEDSIIAEIGDFKAFTKLGKLIAYFGFEPSVMLSGKFLETHNKMSKGDQDCLEVCYSPLHLRIFALNIIVKPIILYYWNFTSRSV